MKWIGYILDKNYDTSNPRQDFGVPSTYIVKRFKNKSYKNVNIKVACLGVYSLYINGHLVNDDFMTSDAAEYKKVAYYRTYNITKYLVEGINVIGFIVSDGWYTSNLSNVGKFVFGQYPNKICYQLTTDKKVIAESDGSEFVSDGEIRATDNQNGIIIDNNFKKDGWSTPQFDHSKWENVDTFDVNIKLVKSKIPQTILQKVFKPKLIKQYDNHYIFDFGQNFTGVTHTIFKGEKGAKIIIKHAEVMHEGFIYTDNLRSALAKDVYTLSGGEEEEFIPRHTFHGFRYVDIEIIGNASLVLLEGYAFWTKLKRNGYIHTNNKLVNKLYSNVLWGQRCNSLSIPTDCPQRDERMGWLGDAQVFSDTAIYNYDMHNFYKKFIFDIETSMKIYKNKVMNFVPFFHAPFANGFMENGYDWRFNSQGWSDALIILPYKLYLYYGDKNVLKQALPYMKKYMSQVYKTNVKEDGIYKGHTFGDWLSVFESVDHDVYNMAYLAYDNHLIYQICQILGDKDADKYLNNFKTAKKIFREKLFANNKIVGDTQGAYILAYAFNLLNEEEIKDNLVRKITQYNHLTTGFHSTKFLLPTLSKIGRGDLAFALLNRKKYPSWGYMISCGATTMWERWDSYRKDIGFNKDGMNSFNHYSLGAVVEWMYSGLMGISPTIEDPAFKTTIVRPCFDKSVSNFKGSYRSKNGLIKVEYKILDNTIIYKIKGDVRIKFNFDFKNEIISKDKIGENEYIFTLGL